MIHIAVVEDEKLFAEQILNFIRKYEKENNRQIKVTAYSDGEDIVEDYKGEYDIILMDIQMRFMDGMTAAEKIRSLDDEVIIMFITNMIQYAVRGYEVDAMDYVVKPVEYFSFSQKLDKAIARIRKKKEIYITVPTENGVKKLDISRVPYGLWRNHSQSIPERIRRQHERVWVLSLCQRLSCEYEAGGRHGRKRLYNQWK